MADAALKDVDLHLILSRLGALEFRGLRRLYERFAA